MAADEVGGDAVQPGSRVRAGLVVGVPLPEGKQECLRHDVIGRVLAEAVHHVALDVRCVPAEQHGEVLGLMPGELNDGRVVHARARFSLGPALLCHA
jgi:hypothetical protein